MGDDGRRFGVPRRRLLHSLAVIGTAALSGGAGAAAILDDRSLDTTLAQGRLDLTVGDAGSFSWSAGSVAPGQRSVATMSPTLNNAGAEKADHVELDFDNRSQEDGDGDPGTGDSGPTSDTDPHGADGLATFVVVEEFSYTRRDGTTTTYVSGGQPTSAGRTRGISDRNGNGHVDLDDFDVLSDLDDANTDNLDDFQPPERKNGASTAFTLEVSVGEELSNDYQGDVLFTDVTVSLLKKRTQDTKLD